MRDETADTQQKPAGPPANIGSRRSPRRGRSRRPRVQLDIDRIVDAAIAMCDRDGADALTMRNVAAQLGVGVMSLYWYVATKNDLELLIRERVLLEDWDGEGVTGDLRHDLAQLARALRDKIRRHPWVLDVWSRAPDYSTGPPDLGGGLLRHIETSLRIVEDLPLDLGAKAGIIAIVDDYALGFAMDEATGNRDADAERSGSINELFGTSVDEAEYPLLARHVAHRHRMPDADARFEWGLQVLLDGIGVQVERARATSGTPATPSESPPAPGQERAL